MLITLALESFGNLNTELSSIQCSQGTESGTQASVNPFTALKLSAVQQVQESVFNQEGKYLHFKYKEHLKLLLADLRPAPARPGPRICTPCASCVLTEQLAAPAFSAGFTLMWGFFKSSLRSSGEKSHVFWKTNAATLFPDRPPKLNWGVGNTSKSSNPVGESSNTPIRD